MEADANGVRDREPYKLMKMAWLTAFIWFLISIGIFLLVHFGCSESCDPVGIELFVSSIPFVISSVSASVVSVGYYKDWKRMQKTIAAKRNDYSSIV